MTRVEKLREKGVLRYTMGRCVDHDHYIVDGFAVRDICVVRTDDLDSLLVASHAEGVAEGAEALKAEIREHSDHYHGDPTVEGGSYYVVLDAVLAPTKEEDGSTHSSYYPTDPSVPV